MLKRLWLILGPLLIAFVLVVITVFSFPTQLDHSIAQEKANAVAITDSSFKNGLIKRQALSDETCRFVPFLVLANGVVWTVCIPRFLRNVTIEPIGLS